MNPPYFITTEPPNAGLAPEYQDARAVPQSAMYMRNNFPLPDGPPSRFEVVMPGRDPQQLTVADVAEAESIEMTLVLECAGNGRTLMDPIPDGTPWDLGGASVIDVRGAPLLSVIGPIPESVAEVVFTGADRGEVEPEGEIPYQFSLHRSEIHANTPLLVTHIGSEPLTLDHGAPVRLIVPGHYAMKSVKWITRIEGLDSPFDGHFVNKYRYYGDRSEPEAERVGPVQVRSVIAGPRQGDFVPDRFRVFGSAWTGAGEIAEVVVSIDSGATWLPTVLERRAPGLAYWETMVGSNNGEISIMSRATSSDGTSQPDKPRWNRNGYANNVCHTVTVTVKESGPTK